jgi:hypothetical protein
MLNKSQPLMLILLTALWAAPTCPLRSCPCPCCRSKSGEVSSLEGRKRSLEAGMRERRSEVAMQLELMQVGSAGRH